MSAKPRSASGKDERIDLLRGGSMVTSLAGSFGGGLRETRVTALLGYLMALDAKPFLELFGFSGLTRAIRLENHHDRNRSDILVETTEGVGIVEAKIDATDASEQSRKYGGRWTALLSFHHAAGKQLQRNGIRYVHWEELARLLRKLAPGASPKTRFIAEDLLNYLEEHHMIKEQEPVEIYAREINAPATLTLFPKSRLYGCWYESGSRMASASYFAPHFGQSIANLHPGVHLGISYISRIEQMAVVGDWEDFVGTLKAIRGGAWLNKHRGEVFAIKNNKDWDWKVDRKRTFLFLGEPRLVFTPPVRKENLQSGKGYLSKRFLSFDELFKAWGC